jgi:hypothetical protein
MRKNEDARVSGTVIQAKHIPFANDPDLKRTVNRLGSCGSQLAGWVSSAEPRRITSFERKILVDTQVYLQSR